MAADAGTIDSDELAWFIAQARAIRGWYHLEAWRLWADMSTNTYVPYVDENTDQSTLTNDVDIRSMIIDDLAAGTALPDNMGQPGRFNKTVCQFFLAKAYMQMYRDYDSALPLLTAVVNTGTNPAGQACSLMDTYGDIFDIENRNDVESIYTVQYSVNDASGGRNGGYAEVLNFPYKSGKSPGGCCGFFNPTQDFVNSFRTDANGLPFLDNSYNGEKVSNDQGLAQSAVWDKDYEYLVDDVATIYDDATDPYTDLQYRSLTGTEDTPNVGNDPLTSPGNWVLVGPVYTHYAGQLDPRLDWSVGRRGIPYWDWGRHTGSDWIRDQTYSGPFSPKKQVYQQSQLDVYTEVGNWTSGYTANGYRMARYSDAVLLLAECKAMTNTGDYGFAEVNLVRARAANTDGFVYVDAANTIPAANYVIDVYTTPFASGAEAMVAIKFERKLELGQEGHRYYDLQRWGDVQTELTRILAYEKTQEWGNALYGGATIGSEDVNFPLPQRQIDLANGNLIQNR